MSSDDSSKETLEAAYKRLREELEGKQVSEEALKVAALDALERAKAELEKGDAPDPTSPSDE